MDPIKEAFSKIKEDIFELKQEITSLKDQLTSLKTATLNSERSTSTVEIPFQNPTQPLSFSNQTDQQTNKPTNNPTQNQALEGLKPLNLPISTGNGGVPTDKQTNRQTNQHIPQHTSNPSENGQNNYNFNQNQMLNEFEQAKVILDSLDSLKKEIRLKFKRLTAQEMLVFSTIYSLDEQNTEEITYKLIASNLSLSESSIRDYINKIIKKGIPILKIKQNNKKITLKISSDLQNIASLSTIIQLRDL